MCGIHLCITKPICNIKYNESNCIKYQTYYINSCVFFFFLYHFYYRCGCSLYLSTVTTPLSYQRVSFIRDDPFVEGSSCQMTLAGADRIYFELQKYPSVFSQGCKYKYYTCNHPHFNSCQTYK